MVEIDRKRVNCVERFERDGQGKTHGECRKGEQKAGREGAEIDSKRVKFMQRFERGRQGKRWREGCESKG